MCGFVGYWGPGQVSLEKAARRIIHRGPDMQNITEGEDWSVAFNRLSILDLSDAGMQPFRFGGVTVFLNGEIYNYKELLEEHKHLYQARTGSDVEVVPFLYLEYGISFLDKLNGMFAMVIIDDNRGVKYLVRDRFGKKPLFYKRQGAWLYFASEVKALGEIVSIEPSSTNIAVNLCCWFLPQPLSLYKDTFQVKPGCYLEYSEGQSTEKRWYRPNIKKCHSSFSDLRAHYLALLENAIQIRLRSDVPVGIFLSGGMDSSALAHYSHRAIGANFTAFTAEIEGKAAWAKNYTDSENPSRFCLDRGIGQCKTSVGRDYWLSSIGDIVGHYDEIFLNSGWLVFYALSERAARKGVKVILAGVGGDEAFGGYPWQAKLGLYPQWLSRYMAGQKKMFGFDKHALGVLYNHLPGRVGKRIYTSAELLFDPLQWHASSLCPTFKFILRDRLDEVRSVVAGIVDDYYAYAESLFAPPADDWMNMLQFMNIFTVMGNQNYSADLTSMRHSVEIRSPFEDYRLLELMMGVPHEIKVKGGHKSLMRDFFRGVLPDYVVDAPKSGPTLNLQQVLADASLRGGVAQEVHGALEMIGDTVSGCLAQRIKGDELLNSFSPLEVFSLYSLACWLGRNLES